MAIDCSMRVVLLNCGYQALLAFTSRLVMLDVLCSVSLVTYFLLASAF